MLDCSASCAEVCAPDWALPGPLSLLTATAVTVPPAIRAAAAAVAMMMWRFMCLSLRSAVPALSERCALTMAGRS